MPEWRNALRWAADEHKAVSDFSKFSVLADEEKERLCRALLSEFGATTVRTTDGGELIHCCTLPWHEDRKPSASLNFHKLTYNCLGCGSKGGLLWYIGSCRHSSATEARHWLEGETGTGADEQTLSSLLAQLDAIYGPSTTVPAPLPRMSANVLKPWRYIHPYLTEIRGIPETTVRHFQVGWDPDANRIVIPHFWKGDLVGWQTRRLWDDGSPKYRSSPDFPKDQTIYNYHDDHPVTVVVESPMSVLSKHHTLVNMEATFGASVTDRQCRALAAHRRVLLFFDNDTAGWNATDHVAERLDPYSEVFVVASEWAADPADMDDGTFVDLLDTAVPYPLWHRPPTLQPWRTP